MKPEDRLVDLKSFDTIAAAAEETGIRPLDALDGILDLVSFVHSDPGKRIIRGHVDFYAHRQMTIEGGNVPLSAAFPGDLRIPILKDAYEADGNSLTEGWLSLFDSMIGPGTVYVSPRMVKIISDLAYELDEDPTLRETDVPFEVGTVWLGAPVTLGEYAEKNRVPIRVIGWSTRESVTVEHEDGTTVAGRGVTTLSFMKGREVLEANLLAKGFTTTSPDTGKTAADVIREERVEWIPWETQAWSYDEPWREATEEETERYQIERTWTREDAAKGIPEPEAFPHGVKPEEVAIVRRFLWVLWRLMAEEVAVPVDFHPERQARRRVERSKRPELAVRVIHLRRLYDPAVTLTDEEKAERKRLARVWSHRWRVRTHWRRQPYGPRGSGLYRMVRIESYVKGPEEKPLIEKPTVWSLDR